MASAVVADGGADVFGDGGEGFDEVLGGFVGEVGLGGDGGVEVGDVGLVVFAVVDLHGGGVDGGLESVGGVGKRGECGGHVVSLSKGVDVESPRSRDGGGKFPNAGELV